MCITYNRCCSLSSKKIMHTTASHITTTSSSQFAFTCTDKITAFLCFFVCIHKGIVSEFSALCSQKTKELSLFHLAQNVPHKTVKVHVFSSEKGYGWKHNIQLISALDLISSHVSIGHVSIGHVSIDTNVMTIQLKQRVCGSYNLGFHMLYSCNCSLDLTWVNCIINNVVRNHGQ